MDVEMFSLDLSSKPKKSEKQTPLLLTTLSISSWCRPSLPSEWSQISFSRPALSDRPPFSMSAVGHSLQLYCQGL